MSGSTMVVGVTALWRACLVTPTPPPHCNRTVNPNPTAGVVGVDITVNKLTDLVGKAVYRTVTPLLTPIPTHCNATVNPNPNAL